MESLNGIIKNLEILGMPEWAKQKKVLITFLVIVAILLVSVIAYWIRADRRAYAENLNKNFSGIIERIEYDAKQFPSLTINDSIYYIGAGYNTDHQIEVGDFIIKKQGIPTYRLIKYRSKKVIEFNN